MSATALERLKADLQQDDVLHEDFQALDGDIALWVRWAGDLGYELTTGEAESLVEIHGELSDDDLELAAGGWPDPVPPPSSGGG